MTLERAAVSKIDKLPANIQAKVEAGKKLKGVEDQIMKAFAGLQDELNKKPEDRVPVAFREDYECVLDLDDEVSIAADDDGEHSEMMDDDVSIDGDGDNSSETVTPVKKPVKKKKKIALEEKNINTTTKNQKVAIKKKLKSVKEKTRTVPSPSTEIGDIIGEAELSDGDDEKMDEDSEEVVIEDDEDDEDLNYDEEEKVEKKKKKKKAATSKKPPDGDTQKRLKKEKKIAADKPTKELKHVGAMNEEEDLDTVQDAIVMKRRKADRLRKLKLKEAKGYSACVKRFKSVTDALSEAVKTEDRLKVLECMKDLKKDVNALTAPFIEEYKLAYMIKSTKTMLVGDEQKIRKDLWEEMKVVYATKKANVPEGWQEALAKLEVKNEVVITTNSNTIQKKTPESNEDKVSQDKRGASVTQEILDPETNGTHGEVTSVNKVRLDLSRQSSGGVELEIDSLPRKPGFQKPKIESLRATPITKPVKKKTTLSSWKNLMNNDKPKEIVDAKKPLKPRLLDETIIATKLPDWLTKEQEVDPVDAWNEDRDLGLEFFDEAAAYFPDTVNRTSVARALERATFAWATGNEMVTSTDDDKWKITYWCKVHSIVGAMAGKHNTGTLVEAILDGKYESAKVIIGLPNDVLFASFEGKPIGGSS